MKKILLFIGILFFIFTTKSYSACTADGDTAWTTDGNESADVQECIDGATAGDTINIIAGDGEATWASSAVTIADDTPVVLVGPGVDNLKIILGGHYAITVNPYIETDELPATRITALRFESPEDLHYNAILIKGQGWRIDGCAYTSIVGAANVTTGPFVTPSGINTTIQPFGLIDNNTIINGKIVTSGPPSFNSTSAAWIDDIDLGGSSAVYIEDNNFSTTFAVSVYKRLAADATQAGKMVVRYNTITQSDIINHGVQTDTGRGTRKTEVYGNSFKALNDLNTANMVNLKSGTGMVFNNADTSAVIGEEYDNVINLRLDRSTTGVNFPLAGPCNGTSAWDGNIGGEDGWVCRDQIGAGTDAYAWVDPPQDNPAPTQTLTPFYFWSNVLLDGSIPDPTYTGTAATWIQDDRDYYQHDPSFDGTSGVGCGSLDNRPATCTTGVAYWATDQSCTDMTGMVGVDPTTPIDGTLYKCTSTDTWTSYYTPYTYPHPLTVADGLITVSNVNDNGTLIPSNINSGGLTVSNVN